MTNIKEVLKKLDIEDSGKYENQFYIITIPNSNDYAKIYSKLSKAAENTGYPSFEQNTSGNTVKVANYFELDVDNTTYNLFLIADFVNDTYYLKIGEKSGEVLM